ncbi:hypothetical protein DENSPDRAFT_887036, partial [Dentipellis sp. KUC8613]
MVLLSRSPSVAPDPLPDTSPLPQLGPKEVVVRSCFTGKSCIVKYPFNCSAPAPSASTQPLVSSAPAASSKRSHSGEGLPPVKRLALASSPSLSAPVLPRRSFSQNDSDFNSTRHLSPIVLPIPLSSTLPQVSRSHNSVSLTSQLLKPKVADGLPTPQAKSPIEQAVRKAPMSSPGETLPRGDLAPQRPPTENRLVIDEKTGWIYDMDDDVSFHRSRLSSVVDMDVDIASPVPIERQCPPASNSSSRPRLGLSCSKKRNLALDIGGWEDESHFEESGNPASNNNDAMSREHPSLPRRTPVHVASDDELEYEDPKVTDQPEKSPPPIPNPTGNPPVPPVDGMLDRTRDAAELWDNNYEPDYQEFDYAPQDELNARPQEPSAHTTNTADDRSQPVPVPQTAPQSQVPTHRTHHAPPANPPDAPPPPSPP